MNYTDEYSKKIDRLKSLIDNADAIVIGAGAMFDWGTDYKANL